MEGINPVPYRNCGIFHRCTICATVEHIPWVRDFYILLRLLQAYLHKKIHKLKRNTLVKSLCSYGRLRVPGPTDAWTLPPAGHRALAGQAILKSYFKDWKAKFCLIVGIAGSSGRGPWSPSGQAVGEGSSVFGAQSAWGQAVLWQVSKKKLLLQALSLWSILADP